MKTIKLYHNPRCSKSRAALALLESHGFDVEVIEYLKTPPSEETLHQLATKLVDDAETLFRTKEKTYAKIASLPLAARLKALSTYPELLERPIVETKTQAVVARPPEKLLTLIEVL